MSETTSDGFLDGRLTIEQSARGYRAGADPVLLAAAVDVEPGASVLELGCGVGTALMCLGHRVPRLDLAGLERDAAAAGLAVANARRNGIAAEIVTGDLAHMPRPLRARRFDAVMLNPPFFDRRHGSVSRPSREGGRGEGEVRLATWLKAASRRLEPRGRLVMIQHIHRLPEALAALDDSLGGIRVRPIAARPGDAPERFILTAWKASRAPFGLAPSLIMHDPDGGDSAEARAILRDGLALDEALLTHR